MLTSLRKAEIAAFGLGVEESGPSEVVIRIVRDIASQDDGFWGVGCGECSVEMREALGSIPSA